MKNLHSWNYFYTTAGRDGRDKFQVWSRGRSSSSLLSRRHQFQVIHSVKKKKKILDIDTKSGGLSLLSVTSQHFCGEEAIIANWAWSLLLLGQQVTEINWGSERSSIALKQPNQFVSDQHLHTWSSIVEKIFISIWSSSPRSAKSMSQRFGATHSSLPSGCSSMLLFGWDVPIHAFDVDVAKSSNQFHWYVKLAKSLEQSGY